MLTYPVLPWYYDALVRSNVRVVTYATVEPVTLDEAREHLRLDLYGSPLAHPDDSLLENIYIPAAREYCEIIWGGALAYQEYEVTLRGYQSFYTPLYEIQGYYTTFPWGPARSVISVTSTDGVTDTLVDPTTYTFDPYFDVGRLYLPPVFPYTMRVRYWAGFDTVSASPLDLPMPKLYKAAILLMIGHLYENRSDTEVGNNVPKAIELGVKALLKPTSFAKGFG